MILSQWQQVTALLLLWRTCSRVTNTPPLLPEPVTSVLAVPSSLSLLLWLWSVCRDIYETGPE
jgi:hypothetical protein